MVSKNTYKPVYQQAKDVKTVDVPHGLVVFCEADDLHYLNHTAGAVFLLCARPMAAKEIAQVLTEEFQLEDAPIDEVEKCLRDLVEKRVLVETR